jgi:hypothetical protein
MYRFRPGVMFAVLGVLLFAGAIGAWGHGWLSAAAAMLQSDGFSAALVFLSTAAVIGLVSGIRRRLPNYGGEPPVSDLLRIEAPYAVVILVAAANIWATQAMMRFEPDAGTGLVFAWHAARMMNYGAILFSLHISVAIYLRYRTDVSWERNAR